MFVLKILLFALPCVHRSFLKCRICFWPPHKLKNLFSETRETQKKHDYKTYGCISKTTAPKSFLGKLHQTLSYRAQGRAFPLVYISIERLSVHKRKYTSIFIVKKYVYMFLAPYVYRFISSVSLVLSSHHHHHTIKERVFLGALPL
jgi:hypothetical protein